MQTLQLSLDTARQLYPDAAPEFKTMLEETFTKTSLVPNILERVKTVADACRELNRDIDTLFESAADDYERAEIAIKTFAAALREGKPASECFYYPYFVRSVSGFSFGGNVCVRDSTYVGARLRVDTAEKARHLGRCMEAYYKTYLIDK